MTIDIHFSGSTLEEIQDAMRSFLDADKPAIHVFDTCAKHLETFPTVTDGEAILIYPCRDRHPRLSG